MNSYPKIRQIISKSDYSLTIRFENGIVKEVNFTDLSQDGPFTRLRNPIFFRMAMVDDFGYGIRWSDDLDISEAYVWEHGKLIN